MSDRGERFAVGRAIGEMFSVWFRRIGPFTLLCVIVLLPLTGYRLWLSIGSLGPRELHTHDWVTFFVWFVLSSLAIAAASRGVLDVLSGRGMSIGRSLLTSLRRAPHAVGAHLPVPVAWASFLLILDGTRDPSVVGGLLGIVFVLILTTLWVAVPVTIVEKVGPFEAWRRSAILTQRCRGSILVLTMVVFLVFAGLGWLQSWFMHDVRAYWAATALTSALGTGLYAVATAVTYHQLRRAHEGVEAAEIAKVFD